MNTKIVTYLKRMGFAAFMFFFLKGLAWLAVFYFGWQVIGQDPPLPFVIPR